MRVALTKIGGSRAIILPSVWFKQHEDEPGTMQEVEMEISETITISPIKKEGGTNGSAEKPSNADGNEAADPTASAA